jgi:Flp pilus assembly protein TadD
MSRSTTSARVLCAFSIPLGCLGAGRASAAPETAAVPPNAADPSLAKNDCGMTLYRQKKYPEALAAFEHACRLDTSNTQAVNNVGILLNRPGRVKESAVWLERTVAMAPERGPAYVDLGDAYAMLGKNAEAVKAYERDLELMPESNLVTEVRAELEALK